MIGRLRGTLVEKQPPWLLLDVHGVGYEVEATMSTFYELPAVGEECTLYTHLVVRDDAHLLFGFASEAERTLFRRLIRITGVGAKLALTILSGMSVEDFGRCVQGSDSAALTRLPGVGKKTAERLIVELRDGTDWQGAAVTPPAGRPLPAADPVQDAVSALTALGYKPQEASRMVRAVAVEGLGSEEIIRSALQAVVK
ncbi:MAG TPA: Holliday junction branch migration protein RuvA [Gammaproteobacteria bacterium]|nr:Holliday junction branch migration protein RuvA [Gammaproteobacteria bacterium]